MFKIIALLFFPVLSYASPCSTTVPAGIETSRTCRLEWQEKKNNHAIEVIYLRNGCQKYEGSPAQNCYLVRTCSSSPKDDTFTSSPIMDTPEELDGVCHLQHPESRVLLGAKDETPRSPASAEIECQGGKAKAIILKSPDKKRHSCPIP